MLCGLYFISWLSQLCGQAHQIIFALAHVPLHLPNHFPIKPCIIPSSTGYCYSMSFSAKIIFQNNISLYILQHAIPYFFYMVDIILTHHLHAFPNNTLLILFQKTYLETRRSPQNNFARQGLWCCFLFFSFTVYLVCFLIWFSIVQLLLPFQILAQPDLRCCFIFWTFWNSHLKRVFKTLFWNASKSLLQNTFQAGSTQAQGKWITQTVQRVGIIHKLEALEKIWTWLIDAYCSVIDTVTVIASL